MLFTPESEATMQTIVDDSFDQEVTFYTAGSVVDVGSTEEYDPLTDTDLDIDTPLPTGGQPPLSVTVPCAKTTSDPDRFAATGLSLVNAISLRVQNTGFEPKAGMTMVFGSDTFEVKAVKKIGRKPVPALYLVDGNG